MRCSACGALGHRIGADGLCSSTSNAVSAVLDGAQISEAAEIFGVSYGNVWAAVRRARARIEPTTGQLRAYRRTLIARRAQWQSGEWRAARAHMDRAAESAMLEWPPEISEPPRIDTSGAEHERIPDPPWWAFPD